MEYKNNRPKKQSILFIVALLLLITFQAHAITTFTVNGGKSLTVDREEKAPLTFRADTASPGGSLSLEIYLDFQGDGEIDPEDILMPFGLFEELIVTDGVKEGWLRDEDGRANSRILTTIPMVDEPFVDLFFPHVIIRAVDEDGSSDSVAIHIKKPETGQTVSGRVTDEDGAPIGGTPLMGASASFGGLPTLWTAVANADGEYILPIDAGMVTVGLLGKEGYYSESPIQYFKLAEGENKTDVDFVMKVDATPPTIQHEPPESAIINNSLLLEAVIEDKESGVESSGDIEDVFKPFDLPIPPAGVIPRVYFRAKGSAGDFMTMVMYPKYDIKFPEPLPPFPMPELGEVGGRDDEEVGVRPGEQVGPDGRPIFQNGSRYQLLIPGRYITPAGLEYYIEATDRAKNVATSPLEAPNILHIVDAQKSPYVISGNVRKPDGTGVADVEIHARAAYGFAGGTDVKGLADNASANTDENGDYQLFLIAPGEWHLSILTPSKFYIVFPKEFVQVVQVREEKGYSGYDWVIEEDNQPPVIEHNPATDVTASSVGEDVIIRARITDDSEVTCARVVIVSEFGFQIGDVKIDEDVEPDFADIIAPPRPDERNAYTFVIPGYSVTGDIEYFIEAFDRVGNVATHPAENPRLNPHLIKIEPAPYSIVGKVTLETPDGEGLRFAVVTATSNAGDYRKTVPKEDGTFTLPVRPGTWKIEAFMRGMALLEPIEPIVVEDEGEYEVNIVLAKDEKPPIIDYTPLEKLVFGEAMKITVSVTDEGRVATVLIRISLNGEEASFKASLTSDGKYTADLISIFHRFPIGKTTEIQYNLTAIDATGNQAVSETYAVPLEIPYTISGKVTVDGEQREGLRIFFDNEAVKSFTDTEADGSYSIPATLGKNTITVERGYVTTDGSPLEREIDVQPDKQYTNVNFELKWTGKIDREDRVPAEESREGWLRADVIGDRVINISDLVFIGKRFGEKIEGDTGTGPNPDINRDGVVDIADLALVAKHFGEILSTPTTPFQAGEFPAVKRMVIVK